MANAYFIDARPHTKAPKPRQLANFYAILQVGFDTRFYMNNLQDNDI